MWASVQEVQEFFETEVAPNCSVCGCNPCCFQCPNSPMYYSDDQERADSLYQDSMSQSEWFSAAVRQYELVHGQSYCS